MQPLELLHLDVWGPAPVRSREDHLYYVSIVDDFSRYSWMLLLNTKSEFVKQFIPFFGNLVNIALIKKEFDPSGSDTVQIQFDINN